MFGPIGGPELILILVLALLLFGPRKLPQIGRTIGKALSEFRSVTNEFKSTLDREVALDDLRETHNDLKNAAREVKGAVHGAVKDSESARPSTEPKELHARTEAEAPAPREIEGTAEKPVTPDGGSTDKA